MILSRIKELLAPAPTPEESVIIFKELVPDFSEIRASDPNFDVYGRPASLTEHIGVHDHDAPTAEEQRTAYRGLISTLTRRRAYAVADAMCEAKIVRKLAPKVYEDVAMDHPWARLLENPSPNLSPYDFWADVSQMRDLGKGAFALGGFDSRGMPDSLWLIYPRFGTINAVPTRNGGIEGYIYMGEGGATTDIPADQMVWLRHRHPVTPYEGASLLEQSAYESDIGLYQAIYARDMAAEGNVPPIYAKFKTDLTTRQATSYGRMLTKEYMSAGAQKKVLVLGSDGELRTIGINPDDLQYVESAALNDTQIMRIFGFPPAMFQESGVVANSEEVRKEWMQSLQREVNQLCFAMTHELKRMFRAEDSDLMIMPPDMIPLNAMEKHRIREIKLRTGQATPNDFRREDSLDEYPEGDQYFITANLLPVFEATTPEDGDLESPEVPQDEDEMLD